MRAGNGTSISVKQKLRRSPTDVVGEFLRLSNHVVIVGLFLRRANGVRPYNFVAVGFVFQPFFYIQFSSCERGAGSAFLCDQNLSSCSPNSRPQNVSSYTATSQDIRFELIPLG